MAEAALAPTAPSLAPPDLPPPPASAEKAGEAEIAEAKTLQPKLTAIQDEEQSRLASLDKQWNDVPRPQFQPPPQPTVQSTDPKTVWASSAMVLAAIGSMFTRQPLTTAMNAAAQVLTAYHEGDQAKANAAFATWKVANENYVKAFTIQNDAYNQVRDHIGKLEELTFTQAEAAKKDAIAQTDALSHAFNDYAMLNLREWDDKVRLMELREQRNLQMIEAGDKLTQEQLVNKTMADWTTKFTKDNRRPPTNEETLEHYGEVRQQVGHAMTPEQQDTQVAKFKASAPKTLEGQAYNAGKTNLPGIMQYDPNRPVDTKTAIQQVAMLDNYIKTLNGNRAMRGFQFSLLQKDEGLLNTLAVKLQQIGGSGPLSKDMAEEIQRVALGLMHVSTLNYGDYITSQQWGQWHHGIDPAEVVPDEWNPEHDDRLYGTHPVPNAKQIDYLKQRPSRANWLNFDELFGQGAAANVFSEFGDQ